LITLGCSRAEDTMNRRRPAEDLWPWDNDDHQPTTVVSDWDVRLICKSSGHDWPCEVARYRETLLVESA
jgi:hypothetical protein